MANNPKKYASLTTLQNLVSNIKSIFVKKTDLNAELAKKADLSHTHTIANVTNLQSTLDGKVPTSRTINNKPLSANITLSASDVGAATSSHDHSDKYYGKTEIDTKLASKSDTTHNHDTKYDGKGTASSAVSTHNTSTSAHNDIRDLITGLTNRLNALADSDDTTLDQMSEIVTYIKNNKSLIDSVTTNKVNVADIIDNLTTNVTNKPLSAAQGVELQRLIDALGLALSNHDTNTTKHITSTERTNWNTAKTLAENAVKKTGDTMSGSLTVQMDTDTAPQFTLKGEANSSGQRTSTVLRKYAFANSDHGTEIEDKTFDGSFMRLNLQASATNPAELITFKNRVYSGSSYSDKDYKLYGEHNKPTLSDIGLTATATELNYVDGVTSNIQAQIDSKLDADAITGGASTIVSDNLTTNRVLVSDNYGKVSASSITGGELSYLDGATRNIQTQINELQDTVSKKVDTYGDTMTGNLTIEPNTTYYPRIRLVGNANTSGQKAESSFDKVTGSTSDQGTNIVDTTFDGRETTLILQSNSTYDEQKLRLRIADADGNYEDYYIYGEHNKPTIDELGGLENSGTGLYYFVNDRNVMYASNIVGDDVMPFIDVSLRSGRKITVNELLKYLKNNSGVASVSTLTTAEYTALEKAQATNANTLYMLTDAEEETPTQVQIVTWESDD